MSEEQINEDNDPLYWEWDAACNKVREQEAIIGALESYCEKAEYELDWHSDELRKLEVENRRLKNVVDAFSALINESGGVYGLHLNGDPAPWDELMAGGRYEEWLLPLALLGGGDE